jgi:c-di-GMP-binding flagellar brake protein YcgR
MSDALAQLKIGDPIQIQLAGDRSETRHIVRVIGGLPGVSLLVSTPRANGHAMLMREGQGLTVRLMSGNSVFGFESKVVRVCVAPFAYLHVAYPTELASTVVRKAQRASTNIIASVENANRIGDAKEPASVVISDLSVAGASLLAPTPFGAVGDPIMVRMKLTVGGIEKYLALAAVIRGVREREGAGSDNTRQRHGVEFQMLEPDDQLVLHGYVYEQIAQGKAI